MNYDPIINSKLNAYKKNYGIENLEDNEAFEQFVNNLILRTYQPEAFSVINSLFDQICVGGQNDTGIDGLAIKVNGVFVATKEDVDDILKKNNRIDVEIIFIQSKFKKNINSGEFGKFMDGIVDYLSENQYEPHNAKILSWLELKEYICSEDILIHWNSAPNIKIYYVYTGEWNDDEHIVAKYERTHAIINQIGLYGNINIKYLDASRLKKLCDDVDNQFKQVITIIDSLELNEAPSVESSRVLFCYAKDFVNLLIDDEEELRRTLFKDNVRDYQGNTDINEDIFQTLKDDPSNFCLLNNGITIVCKSMVPGNRKISIENPKIVNGCQTCNTIFKAYKENVDISEVTLIIKLIATDNVNVTNSIVKGTNRQNVVYDEAFEITRKFHKDFEEFVEVIQGDIELHEKIYYERRSNQYANSPLVKISQKANFKVLIQGFVSVIMQYPHEGFIHDSTLLSKYQDRIFIEGQSFYPYYLAIYLYINADKIFKFNYAKYKEYTTYKHHILCLLVEKIAGPVPDINNTKRINEFCKKVLNAIVNKNDLCNYIDKAIELFNEIKSDWISEKGEKFKYSIKDHPSFTKYMLTKVRGGNTNNITGDDTESIYRGTVVTVKKDRNDLFYGYIKKYPLDVFIHEDDNPHIRFYDLQGKDVVYTTTDSGKYNNCRGKIKYVVTRDEQDI